MLVMGYVISLFHYFYTFSQGYVGPLSNLKSIMVLNSSKINLTMAHSIYDHTEKLKVEPCTSDFADF